MNSNLKTCPHCAEQISVSSVVSIEEPTPPEDEPTPPEDEPSGRAGECWRWFCGDTAGPRIIAMLVPLVVTIAVGLCANFVAAQASGADGYLSTVLVGTVILACFAAALKFFNGVVDCKPIDRAAESFTLYALVYTLILSLAKLSLNG